MNTQGKQFKHSVGLEPIGACHYCSTYLRDSRLFCDRTCEQFHEEEEEAKAKENGDVVTEHKA